MSIHQSKFKDKSTVIVKPLAYYKMLVHILRFGNKVRDRRQYKEVMGILIGRLEGEGTIKNVIIEDAVPVSHGGSIEVAFKPEDYITFSYVDAEYAEQDPPLFSVGWYHSHPALKIFFSSTDIKNQLGWQTPNPSAIGIVFDHTYLENPGDMGFRTFRLDAVEKGPLTDYHEVNTIVEPPDSEDYYLKIMELINSIHAREPPILEINETPDLFGDMLMPGQSQIMSKQPELELTNMITALKDSMSSFIDLSIEPVIRFLNSWSQEMIKKTVENNLQMRTDLIELKDKVSAGVNSVQTVFKSSLTNKLYDLDAYIDDHLEGFDKDIEVMKNAITQMKEQLNTQIEKIFEEKVNNAIKPLLELIEQGTTQLSEINEKNTKNIENLEAQQTSIENLSGGVGAIQKAALEKVNEAQEKLKKSVSEKVEQVIGNFSELNKKSKEFSSDLDTSISMLESSRDEIKAKLNKPEGGA